MIKLCNGLQNQTLLCRVYWWFSLIKCFFSLAPWCHFLSDFPCNPHISNIIQKCYRRIFIFRNLKRASCPSQITYNCCVAFIRFIIIYCFFWFLKVIAVVVEEAFVFEKNNCKILSVSIFVFCQTFAVKFWIVSSTKTQNWYEFIGVIV